MLYIYIYIYMCVCVCVCKKVMPIYGMYLVKALLIYREVKVLLM